MPRTALLLTSLLILLAASPAVAFRNVGIGSVVENASLLAMDGVLEPLLARDCGAPTVVLFWATWSPRSAEALADAQQLHAGKGVAVAAVNVDTEAAEGPLSSALVQATQNVDFPVFVDRGLALYEQWGVVAVPSMALVDAGGRVVHVLDGYAPGQRTAFLREAAAQATGAGDCVGAVHASASMGNQQRAY